MKKFNSMLIIQHVRELWNGRADLQEVLDEANTATDNANNSADLATSAATNANDAATAAYAAADFANSQKLDFVDYKGTVDNYAELAGLTELENGDAYVNAEDGLVYVWNGTSFPADGDGLDVSMKPIGEVEDGNAFAVSGGEVYKLGVIFDDSELITANTSNCEIGSISSDGSRNVSRDDRFRFNDYFPCTQGAEIKCPNGWDMAYHIYDENKVQIGSTKGWFSGTHIVEPCPFLRVKFKKSNDAVVVLSDITADFSVNVKNIINFVQQNTEDIASFEKVNHQYIEILGESVPINRNSNDKGTFYYTNQKILQNRRIKTIEVNITTAGTFSVVKGENLYRDEYTEEIIGVFDVTEGLNILPVDFHLNYGEFIGFGSYTDTATFGYNWVAAGVGNYNGNPIFGGFSYKISEGVWVSSINDLNIKIGVELNSISQNNIKPLTLTGKKISFIGDSITTYAGFIPAGSAVYYPKGDVDVVDKTWWHRLIKQTGMILDVNNSWSGSTISGSGASAFTSRVSNIGTPDICLIFGGTNDYRDGVPIGDWNYDDADFDTSQFKQSAIISIP